ncbi:MAG: sugar nucleotide-binding protein, partial [Pseudomonadota bacterium]
MRLLITGSDGFTGSHYCQMGRDQGHEILGTDVKNTFMPEGCRIETLDIRDEKACRDLCASFRPDAIIHTARAPGNLWQTEQDRMNTYRINVLGTKALGRCAEDLGAAFIFLSTDWVFSGTRPEGQKYDEEDDGGPLNYYGVTKWIAEQEIRRLKTRWLIIRPAHIYGFHAAVLTPEPVKGPDLLQRTVWAGIGNAVRNRTKIRIPEDMFQTPIYVKRLVETTMKLLEKDATGIYHLADRDCASR